MPWRPFSHAGTALGVLATDGVVIAAEKKVTSPLLETDRSHEKLYILNNNLVCGVAGLTADANILVNSARQYAQSYLMTYGSDVPVESLVKRISDSKQAYTQYGGLRPFGVSILYAGYDRQHGFQLYHSDPSGNYGGWKATCVGANTSSAQSVLKQEYSEDLSLDAAIGLALKVLTKTMDTATPSSDTVEIAVMKIVDGKITPHVYSTQEVKDLLALHKEALDSAKADS
ncbi:Proteasome subunit alpha type-3 [Entomophthora muscae]|uniref:Proteasome subunit alpha type-3 n=1 Tax=Entomophthora muscae TaxID=34485 RepID=A0ACC2RTU6_9FUNG|nr:Proteasome subunit alpha type-3 [Entomophthora muscae]